MSAAIVSIIGTLIGKTIDRAIPDKDEAQKLKAEAMQSLLAMDMAKLETASKVMVADAQGESWIQRTWRPIVMLWFAALVGAYWLGFTPENLPPEAVNRLLDIVLAGTSLFVVGRSGEKIAKNWKQGEAYKEAIRSESGPKGIF